MGLYLPFTVVQNHFYRACPPSTRCNRLTSYQILFLNKLDLFTDKIQTSDIKAVFPDFDGASSWHLLNKANVRKGKAKDVSDGKEYFKRRFLRLAQKSSRTKEREIYVQYALLLQLPPVR